MKVWMTVMMLVVVAVCMGCKEKEDKGAVAADTAVTVETQAEHASDIPKDHPAH